jgi:hypothetical protein
MGTFIPKKLEMTVGTISNKVITVSPVHNGIEVVGDYRSICLHRSV